ncbi:MAG: YHYH protein [Armatimonadetes bacterium]|nr:YHYH protein [Armatimonadota bacterium]
MKGQPILILALFAVSGVAGGYHALQSKQRANEIQKTFEKYSDTVKTRSDETNFYVESNGIPDHPMMIGITAWQQQVPLPQKYTGANAWQFPLNPVPAKNPLSAKDHFFRGAIAIAANGVPIFNPIKNDGRTDTFLAGELDKYGGHCGRSDDYHYHIAPVILQEKIGTKVPVAYALDGYPIYGYTEPDGKTPKDLDQFNGHTTSIGYHYHATKNYPYINGGFHGEVTDRDGQVDPQPRAQSPRPAMPPLRGAKITDFKTVNPLKSYSLTYTIDGATEKVNYEILADGSVKFDYVDRNGAVRTETYRGRPGRGGGNGGRKGPDQGGGPGQGGPDKGGPGGGGGQLGPPPGPRKPWFVDHAKELDTNKDGEVSTQEVIDQCKESFKQYSQGAEFIDMEKLPKLPTVRLAIGGFIKVHAKELDMNSDGKLTEKEITDSMMRMFRKQDKNGDGKLSGSELEG